MNNIGRLLIPLLFLVPGFLFAQTDGKARMSAEAVIAQQRLIVDTNMQLSKEEEKTFWPVFDEYQKLQDEIYNKLLKLINTYAQQYPNLSDSQARELLQEYVAIEAEVVTLHSEYMHRFEKVLPATKVLRFYQIDFRLMTKTLSDIAAIVPFAK